MFTVSTFAESVLFVLLLFAVYFLLRSQIAFWRWWREQGVTTRRERFQKLGPVIFGLAQVAVIILMHQFVERLD